VITTAKARKWALAGCCCVAAVLAACSHPAAGTDASWNREAAASYLDEREGLWATWPAAARDHGTFCVSCHTALAYSLSRPTLRSALGEQGPSAQELKLIENVTTRVRLWSSIDPYYRDMADQSRGTEAVLNSLILASNDAQTGHITADTLSAFRHLWETQQTAGDIRGAWLWILFDNEPWEAYDSPYYGATLAAAAVGIAPDNYQAAPEIQSHIALLRDYLVRNSAAQTPINRVNLLWASEKLPGLLDVQLQQSIITEILSAQRADGGWSLSSLVGSWKRRDGTPLVLKSDGYATGFITYVLQGAGMPRDDVHVKRGLAWLVQNQTWWGGHWSAYSLNVRRRDPFSNVSGFMDDAATAYAVLALTQANNAARSAALDDFEITSSRSTNLQDGQGVQTQRH
jgi:squalene-hopene/tetraprenyl-beta-curcumene cyclase